MRTSSKVVMDDRPAKGNALPISSGVPTLGETKGQLKRLIDNNSQENYMARAAVASNPSTSVEILRELANDEDSYVKSVALRNPKVPVEFLWEYANSINMMFRSAVASNPSTPVAILEQVIADTALPGSMAGGSKLQAAGHRNFGVERLAELAEHVDPFVRAGVAMNSRTDFLTLVKLLNDPDLMVVSYAQDRINIMSEDELQEALSSNGYVELVGLPKAWVAKVLNSTKAPE